MSKQSGKVQAKSWQPPAVQTASKGFSARPFPEIARKEEGKEASLDLLQMKENQPGGMIDNINRSLAAASPPAPLPILGQLGVQAKLTLGTVGDVYEQEADRVARQVVDEIHSSAFRASNTTSEGESIANGGEAGRVQRQITVRAAGDAGGEISSEWEGELVRAKGGGQPMSPTVREPMERGFGADFSGVRVHTGAQADSLARSIQAKAFTTGQDVFFRQGAYEPGSRGGQELIAHELTHVVQQKGGAMQRAPFISEQPQQYPAPETPSASDGNCTVQAKGEWAGNTQELAQEQRPNKTGLPDVLKSAIESLSSISMDNVNVHYNSTKPAQLNALAYAQGSEIYIAPGQEQHLPHEAWHVVQQAQSRVKPTMRIKPGVDVNNDLALENEANVMGKKAVQIKSKFETHNKNKPTPSKEIPIQKQSVNKVAQLVLATVNPQNGPVNLVQVGGGAAETFMIMQNLTQPEGNDVSNVVGFTGVLNKNAWAGLGKSPADYWRAHAYANSFGGAGDVTNVGWWKETAEVNWTQNEQKVRGAGQAEIPQWRPGIRERGTYLVERQMYPAIQFRDRYVAGLMNAVNWGLNNSRPAWTRAIATCDRIQNQNKRQTRIAQLNTAKGLVENNANGRIQTWVNQLFGNSLETNLIKKMKMTYTITVRGFYPGADRESMSYSILSEQPNLAQFGLKDEPEQIWVQLVNHNQGLFAQATSPLELMTARIPYSLAIPQAAQELRAYADGWGAE